MPFKPGFVIVIASIFLFLGQPQSAWTNDDPCENSVAAKSKKAWSTREILNANLAELRAGCEPDCERNGFFGPDSLMWEVNKIPLMAFLAQKELSRQLAHPAGAQGVWDHSKLLTEPIKRFQRTFDSIWHLIYAPASEAEQHARLVHLMHTRATGIMENTAGAYAKGEIYSALDIDALRWTLATIIDSRLELYELFVRKLSAEEKERYLADNNKFGMLFGIPKDALFKSWAHFEQYKRYMLNSGELTYSEVALRTERHFRNMAREIERQHPHWKFVRVYSDMLTAHGLEPKFAQALGLQKRQVHHLAYLAALTALRTTYQNIPDKLRRFQVLPIYRMAMARANGQPVDPRDEKDHQLMVGKQQFWFMSKNFSWKSAISDFILRFHR